MGAEYGSQVRIIEMIRNEIENGGNKYEIVLRKKLLIACNKIVSYQIIF